MVLKNSLTQSHMYVEKVLKDGSKVIDATCGNGNDTLFLARLVGQNGRVYAFDIQIEALNITWKKLGEYCLDKFVDFIHDSHENLDKYVNGNVDAVMFNLGYLPGGDHSITTRFASTKKALIKSLKILKKNGIITIVIYQGGDSGFEERDKLLKYLATIDQKQFNVMKTEFFNQENFPPILICIEKLF